MSKTYLEKKAEGISKITKVGNQILWEQKRFAVDTGEEIDSVVQVPNLDLLKADRDKTKAQLKDLEDLIADLEGQITPKVDKEIKN